MRLSLTICQITGGSAEDGPDGYEPAMIRVSKPSRAMWSIPLTPYMSPAAIGCSVVIARGWPWFSKRQPIAASTASGHPSAEDDDTVTTAPSGTREAASSAVTILGNPIGQGSTATMDGRDWQA
jgi:hypothetical protein